MEFQKQEIIEEQIDDNIANNQNLEHSMAIYNGGSSTYNLSSILDLDDNTELVKEYFKNLLRYINNNDSTLSNDLDGDLNFFINQIPDNELDLTFNDWIDIKVSEVKADFIKKTDKKTELIKKEFESIQKRIEDLDDDNILRTMAKNSNIL